MLAVFLPAIVLARAILAPNGTPPKPPEPRPARDAKKPVLAGPWRARRMTTGVPPPEQQPSPPQSAEPARTAAAPPIM